MNTRLSFCERVTATPWSPVHIREIPEGEEPKYGGGIEGSALCGRDLLSGWDTTTPVNAVTVNNTESESGPTCFTCAVEAMRLEPNLRRTP